MPDRLPDRPGRRPFEALQPRLHRGDLIVRQLQHLSELLELAFLSSELGSCSVSHESDSESHSARSLSPRREPS
jgi:hypothetical protein